MIDYGYIASLPELTPTSPPGAAYKVTHDWDENNSFNPSGRQYTIYVMTAHTLYLTENTSLGNNSALFIFGTIVIKGTTTLDKGSRIVLGENGFISASESAILHSKQSKFEAPIKQVFSENIQVKGIWEIPTAYPQWFTAKLPELDSPGPSTSESLDNTLHDWSTEINKAITMKGTGEVFLLKGTYNVSNPIVMKPGIQLRGSCGVNWDNNTESGAGSTIIRANVSGTVDNPYDDYIVYVNVIRNNAGEFKTPTGDLFQSGTLIENIHFKAANFSHPRCIVAGCPCHFNNLGFRNFRQAVKYIDVYCDGRRITNCNAGDGFTKKVATTADDDYMFDLYTNGDACVIEGLAVGSRVYKALKIGRSCGSVIQGCIFNAPVHLRGCKATVFTANHMESSKEFNFNADTHLRISNSDVTVQGNYFEKSTMPSVIIEDGQGGNYDTSVVTLSNNQFLYIAGIENSNENPNIVINNPNNTAEENAALTKARRNKAFELILERLTNLSEYDVQVDAHSVVSLYGNFRYSVNSNSGVTSSFPFGISVLKTGNNGNAGSSNGLKDFNDKSFCLSQQSLITGEKIVTNPVILDDANNYLRTLQPVSSLLWLSDGVKQPDGSYTSPSYTYEYEYCVYPGGVSPSTEVFKKISVWSPATTEFGGKGILILVEFGNSGGRGKVKIRRSHTAEGTKVVKTVVVPICGARVLYDNGIAIAGYKWT